MRGIRAVRPGPRRSTSSAGSSSPTHAVRLRRRARLHRPRHRHGVPLRAGHPPLRRRPRYDDRHRARHDVHHRADAQPRHPRVGDVGRRLDRRHHGPPASAPSSSTRSSSPTPAPRSSPRETQHEHSQAPRHRRRRQRDQGRAGRPRAGRVRARSACKIETPEQSTPEAVCEVIAQIVDHFDEVARRLADRRDRPGRGPARRGEVRRQHRQVVDRLRGREAARGPARSTTWSSSTTPTRRASPSCTTAPRRARTAWSSSPRSAPASAPRSSTRRAGAELRARPPRDRRQRRRDGAASLGEDREGLSWEEWAKRLQRYYRHLEELFWPDLFVVGGGVSSKDATSSCPCSTCARPIVPAALENPAGIIGAALLATQTQESRGRHKA